MKDLPEATEHRGSWKSLQEGFFLSNERYIQYRYMLYVPYKNKYCLPVNDNEVVGHMLRPQSHGERINANKTIVAIYKPFLVSS